MNNTMMTIDKTNSDWYLVNRIDFSIKANQKKIYPWQEVLSGIDPAMGRNTMICFLKIKGILDKKNKPNPKSSLFKYFVILIPSQDLACKAYIGNKNIFISGEGIVAIADELKQTRFFGGCI